MRLALLVAPLALFACTQTTTQVRPVPRPYPASGQDTCGAGALQYLVGQPATVLAATSVPAFTRIIRPGMAVTQDFSPSRLNIWLAPGRVLAEGQVIQRVTCG